MVLSPVLEVALRRRVLVNARLKLAELAVQYTSVFWQTICQGWKSTKKGPGLFAGRSDYDWLANYH